MTTKPAIEKPLIWQRIEASDEARCDAITRAAAIKPDYTEARKKMNDAQADLLDAQTAARERFPDDAYDEQTCQALNDRVGHFENMKGKFQRLDSRKRVLDKDLIKITDATLKLLSESREPGIFDAGENLGPHGWKKIKLRDLVGGPDMSKDLEKQTWTSQELEIAGYHTIGEFVQGRGRLIPAMVDSAELASNTLELVDVAVYRFLEKRKLLDQWPKGMDAPTGEQMTLLQAESLTEDPEITEAEGFDGPDAAPKPAPKPAPKGKKPKGKPETAPFHAPALKLSGHSEEADSLIRIPNATAMYPQDPKARTASAKRYASLTQGWVDLDSTFDTIKATDDQHKVFVNLYGACPMVTMAVILTEITAGREIHSELPDEIVEMYVQVWHEQSNKVKTEGSLCDEYTAWFAREIVSLGGDAVRRVAKWSITLGTLVAAFQDGGANSTYYEAPAESNDKPKTTKKKPKKKTAKKKAQA